jgi:D-alanyl-D-alanine carboxypeptidase (penicillin-binding protein 5/6)
MFKGAFTDVSVLLKLKSTVLIFSLLIVSQSLAASPIPAPPKIAATGYLLIDHNSGQVLAEQNADRRLEPASLTKIMTAHIVLKELKLGNIQLEDKVTVSEKAWRTPGSRMFIEVGKQISIENLLKGMIIQSGNDASVALAEHIAGSEEVFAGMMNSQAKELGMDNTNFVNSTGLPHPEHYTTAHDLAIVTTATIREFPEFYPWYAIKELTFGNIKQYNRNKLLWQDESVDGVKTGHTESAGYCLVASAKRNSMRLTSIVMGTDSENARARESKALLNYGFRFFETHRLYGAGDILSKVRVWKGDKEQLTVGLKKDLFVTIPRRQYEKLKASMVINSKITAPVKQGSELGRVDITLEGRPFMQVPLIALSDIAEGGIWQRAVDTVVLWFE